jgi:hypothetical protein
MVSKGTLVCAKFQSVCGPSLSGKKSHPSLTAHHFQHHQEKVLFVRLPREKRSVSDAHSYLISLVIFPANKSQLIAIFHYQLKHLKAINSAAPSY